MELKEYQRKVLERFDQYLSVIGTEKAKVDSAVKALIAAGVDVPGGMDDYPRKAWESLKAEGVLPRTKHPTAGFIVPDYVARHDARQRPFPHVCFKVPTGGGKTLLGAESVGKIHTNLFKRQTGLVLWVMPTVQIYRQTWKALANREHPYRQILERATGGRVKILEKDDPLNKADVENYLCIMLVRLAAANRKNSGDFLKIFRDAGKYSSFFPQVDDYTANNNLLQTFPDLETNDIGDDTALAGVSVKHSLVNVLKVMRPVVVIDEGHKAYSENTRESLNNFNPSFILELTATPNAKHHISNVLVDVSGLDLKDEQMIKLPINILNTKNGDWQSTLTQAHEKLKELEEDGQKLQAADGRYIRPIMVIRVERTGKDQRDGKKIHALDAKDYLLKNLLIHEDQIRIKSSEKDELGSDDLLDPLSPVRYIITKEALQEGWDCPFAYVLTLLDKTTASTAMTQMVGRVLRQPETRTTSIESLNQCYVYCFDQNVNDAVKNVRKGLEEEGMTGLSEFVKAVGDSGQDSGDQSAKLTKIKRRDKFSGLEIFLPRVLHKEGNGWREIQYERDILASIAWEKLSFNITDFLPSQDNPNTSHTKIDVNRKADLLNEQGELDLIIETGAGKTAGEQEVDVSFLSCQLLEIIPNPWQASRVVLEALKALADKNYTPPQIYSNRLYLVDLMKQQLREAVHQASEQIFKQKLKDGTITFKLITSGNKHLNFAIAQELEVMAREKESKLYKDDHSQLEKSLFDIVYEKDFNGLERNMALYLEDDQAVSWWHRMVAKQEYSLQGWQRNKVYPDFMACVDGNRLLVLETKGLHLKGNDDTAYKEKLLDLLTEHHQSLIKAGQIDVTDGTNQHLNLTMLMEDSWKAQFQEAKNG